MGNKTYLYWTVSLLLTLVLGFCQSAQAGGELTTVEASGVGSDVESAAKAGLAQAVRAATGQLPSGGKFQLLLIETVAASADDFVTGYEIINKRHEEDEYAARHPELNLDHPGEWQVQLKVDVNAVALRKRWDELFGLLEKKTPVVLVVGIYDSDRNTMEVSISASHIRSVLEKFSIKIVSTDGLLDDAKFPGFSLVESANSEQVLAIARQLEADMTVISRVEVETTGKQSVARQISTTATLYRSDKVEPIDKYSKTGKPTSEELAISPIELELRIQSRLIMPDVLEGVLRAWPGVMADSIKEKEAPSKKEVE